jgi:hypothetical protein
MIWTDSRRKLCLAGAALSMALLPSRSSSPKYYFVILKPALGGRGNFSFAVTALKQIPGGMGQ